MGGPANASTSVRLFLAPGMGHCRGGEGPDVFDKVGALEEWVERGNAPERDDRVAQHRRQGGPHAAAVPLSTGRQIHGHGKHRRCRQFCLPGAVDIEPEGNGGPRRAPHAISVDACALGLAAFLHAMLEPSFPPVELATVPVLDLNGTNDETLPPATVDANRRVMERYAKTWRRRAHRRAAPLSVHAGQHQGRRQRLASIHRLRLLRLIRSSAREMRRL